MEVILPQIQMIDATEELQDLSQDTLSKREELKDKLTRMSDDEKLLWKNRAK